jgi:hypothetical protein
MAFPVLFTSPEIKSETNVLLFVPFLPVNWLCIEVNVFLACFYEISGFCVEFYLIKLKILWQYIIKMDISCVYKIEALILSPETVSLTSTLSIARE